MSLSNFKQKILNLIQILTIPICFFIFIGLNNIFCTLYCKYVYDSVSIFTYSWALLFCGILLILPTLARRIGIIVMISLFALMNIVHAVMYNLFGNFFTFSDLLYAGEGAAFFSFTYLNARKLLWITSIGAILLSIFLAVNLKKRKYSLLQAAIGVLIILIGVDGISTEHNRILNNLDTEIEWIENNSQDEIDANIYHGLTNQNHTMAMTGIYQYLYRSFIVTSGLETKFSNSEMYQQLDEYFSQQNETAHESNEMSGIYEGKNVMFIMLESIDTWMLTEDYMPNLYSLQQDSMNFVNFYTPLYISAGTFNTEFIANTSLIPPSSGIDTTVYMNNSFPTSIANSFNTAGYSSNSFHGSNPNIYNRGTIHENIGYTKYHSWEDMNMESHALDSQLTNGFAKMTATEPFFSFIITYSGHGPYTEAMSTISEQHLELAQQKIAANPIEASEEDLQEYTYAIAHAMETDAFVGNLIHELTSNDLLEDTVLIFFTDHYGKYMTNHEFLMNLKGVDNKDMLCNTPFFIYHANTEAQTIETLSSTMDILPTIANLFNLDVNYAYYTGVDIFSDCEHYVIFSGNNWYDGTIYFTSDYTGELTAEITERNREITKRMQYSEYILRSDYFNYLSNKE